MSDTRELEQVSRVLIRCAAELHGRGWCMGTGGNFSVLLQRAPLRLLVTASGVDKGRLTPDRLLQVGDRGQPLHRGGGDAAPAPSAAAGPSAETALHLALVRVAGAEAVLHTHSIWGTLLGESHLAQGRIEFTGYEMQKGIEGVTSHEQTVTLPIVANSQEMASLVPAIESAVRAWPASRGVLIAGHGLYAWGRSLEQAQRHVEIYEFLLELAGRRGARPRLEP